MPKFLVRKGQDAYVYYHAYVEADSADEATEIASSWGFRTNGDNWIQDGVEEFDHADVFEEETREVADDQTEEGTQPRPTSPRQEG